MTDVLGSDARLYWEGKAKEYDMNRGIIKTQTGLTERGLELLKPDSKHGSTMLDIGCGTGISTKIIMDNGFSVIGMDISFPMVEIAKRKGLNVLVGDFRFLPFRDNSFQHVFSVSTLQWITGRDEEEIREKYRMVAREIYRVTKERGSVFIQFFPATEGEMEITLKEFKRAGFKGYLVEDEFGDKRKNKRYILLNK